MRTFGVEEEFLVVDQETGCPQPLGSSIVDAQSREPAEPEFEITTELHLEQVEIATHVCESMIEVEKTLLLARHRTDELARDLGARTVAIGASPVVVVPHYTPQDRYAELVRRFGQTAREQLTCGCHVHVSVESDEECIAVIDRIRRWLPVLLAMSTNSPFWNGEDSGYASFRREIWTRLPLSGPTEIFGSAQNYHDNLDTMLGTGVLVDADMVYFDARLSRAHPTVEIRVADVCPDVETAALLASLSRALVETASREWRANVPPSPVSAPVLQLACWQASRNGLGADLLDPAEWRPKPARDVVAALIDHVKPVLVEFGDEPCVGPALTRMFEGGNGADRQRQAFATGNGLPAVVADAIERTHAVPQSGPAAKAWTTA